MDLGDPVDELEDLAQLGDLGDPVDELEDLAQLGDLGDQVDPRQEFPALVHQVRIGG